MADQAQGDEQQFTFSPALIAEFQAHFKDEFGRHLTKAEAQSIYLKVAELVFRKEKRKISELPIIQTW